MKSIEKVFNFFDKLFELMNVLLMGFLAVAVIVTVTLRYVFNISFIWAEEAILFTFIATTYFGSIICVKEDEHISIDYFIQKSSPAVEKILRTIIFIVSVVTLLSMSYLSLGWIDKVGSTLSSGLKVHYKYIYAWMPITFTIGAIYETRKYIKVMLKNKENDIQNNLVEEGANQ